MVTARKGEDYGEKYVKNLMSVVIVVAMVITCFSGTFDISQEKSQPVRLKATPKTLQVGKTYQLKVKKAKGITIKKKSFSKKGTAVKVSKKGKITAKKAGKATVTCKVKYCAGFRR